MTPAFEQLGVFYLGRRTDEDGQLLLYDARDLTTHAVIVGMTGSGKTGLGVALIEEAAIDGIPVIAIDPKGDMANLALRFPALSPADFAPWIDAAAAASAGMSREQMAERTARQWREGLAQWGQDGARIARLADAAEVAVYTPADTAGRRIALLGSLAPPRTDDEHARLTRLQSTVGALLQLLGLPADPLASREHVLLSRILGDTWARGHSPDLAWLVGAVQNPGIERIGVMPLDQFCPPRDRTALAMRLNALLAAPGSERWFVGEPLDAGRLLHDEAGRPRISVMHLAALPDEERMLAITLLLAEILVWMRAQPGTGSLRAILYIDELFGLMPPNGNPATKTLLLTLLKQARAFGLGLVLSTQNPVDLDYKGLSNTGSWFIGRLQTRQDQDRVLDGLMTAGGDADRAELRRRLAAIGKREFYLHNVHEPEAVCFRTRWVLSYLAGPMTRDQLRALPAARAPAAPPAEPRAHAEAVPRDAAMPPPAAPQAQRTPPPVPAGVSCFFLPAQSGATMHPGLYAELEVSWRSARHGVDLTRRIRRFLLAAAIDSAPDWARAQDPGASADDAPPTDVTYAELPAALADERRLGRWQRELPRRARNHLTLELRHAPALKLVSAPDEDERTFRIRLREALAEHRDREVARLRKRHGRSIATLQDRLRRAEAAIEREQGQARQQKLTAAVSFGSALLGALFGRGRAATSARRIGSAARQAGRVRQQADDVARARERAEQLRAQLAELEDELAREVDALRAQLDEAASDIRTIVLRPKSADVQVLRFGIAWRA